MIRLARRLVLALLGVASAYLAASIIGALIPGRTAYVLKEGAVVTIGALRGPIHYDFLLPLTPDLTRTLPFLADHVPLDHPDAKWLVVGWGGRDFYMTVGTYRDVSLSAVWKGATGEAAVLRFALIGEISADAPVAWIDLATPQYSALLQRVAGSLEQPGGAPVLLRSPEEGNGAAFFAATGRFDIFRTCNVWFASTLRAAGQPFGAWTPAPWSVALSLWWFTPGSSGA